MDEVKKDLEKIYKLIKEEAGKIGTTVLVDRKQTLECLTKIKEDIDTKYKETLKLWKQSVKLYSSFMEKAPGSKQMQPPDAKPTLPPSVDIVKGYIDVFNSFSEDKIRLNVSFLEKLYLDSIRGLSDMRARRDEMMVSVSGLGMASSYYRS